MKHGLHDKKNKAPDEMLPPWIKRKKKPLTTPDHPELPKKKPSKKK